MTISRKMAGLSMLGVIVLQMAMSTFVTVAAAAAPTKEILSSRIGWKVDKTTGGNVCTVESKDECQPGEESVESGGFVFPEGVAVAPDGNVYVADEEAADFGS